MKFNGFYLLLASVLVAGCGQYSDDSVPSGTWVLSPSSDSLYLESWADRHVLPASAGEPGYLTAERGERNAAVPLEFTIEDKKPSAGTMVEDDYWLYVLPVKHLEAGSAIDFYATMGGDAAAPKYFIVEYFEDGEWKSVEEDLCTAAEDSSIRYTYMSSGDMDRKTYQHATVSQTIRLGRAIDNGELKIRCRAVGTMTASGEPQDIAAEGHSVIPLYGFTGARIQDFGTAEPKDTVDVLCLGNSFTYFSHSVAMLKEIAYSQGHYLRTRAHLKGGRNLSHHTALSMSLDAVGRGGYEYAFMQDQSQNPARYAMNGTKSIMEGCAGLAALIRAASPSCQIILEETWAFSQSDFGGFGSWENFDSYSEAGAVAMAQENSAWVSPIGKAFKAARENASVNLLDTDDKHQSAYGTYLKSCVNYLVLFGEEFVGKVPNCGLDPEKAAYLRRIAEQTVLGRDAENLIVRK